MLHLGASLSLAPSAACSSFLTASASFTMLSCLHTPSITGWTREMLGPWQRKGAGSTRIIDLADFGTVCSPWDYGRQ